MNKKNSPVPSPDFTGKDADQLIAGYGQAPSPEKKAALLSKLENEREAFTKANNKSTIVRPSRGKERE
jgi:hypothetical protein